MKIGLFDSGLGGLLILKAVVKLLPEYDYEYFGDTLHLPYGDRPESEIYELTKAGVEQLFKKDCLLVILACNTASAETLRRLQQEWLLTAYPDRKLLGVIVPVIEEVIASPAQHLKLLATKRTVSSGKYHLELGKRDEFDTKIEAVAAPALVPLLEAGDLESALRVAQSLIETGDGEVGEVDGLILGCTHYVLLKEALRDHYGAKLEIFSQDEIIPKKLQLYLESHKEIENKLTKNSTRNIFLTEQRGDYDQLIATFLDGALLGQK